MWFYDIQADRLLLDDKRKSIDVNDISDIVSRYHNLETEKIRKPTEKSVLVPK